MPIPRNITNSLSNKDFERLRVFIYNNCGINLTPVKKDLYTLYSKVIGNDNDRVLKILL